MYNPNGADLIWSSTYVLLAASAPLTGDPTLEINAELTLTYPEPFGVSVILPFVAECT